MFYKVIWISHPNTSWHDCLLLEISSGPADIGFSLGSSEVITLQRKHSDSFLISPVS